MEPNSKIGTLLEALDEYLQELEERTPTDYSDYQEDIEKRRFVERTLQIAIQACIDICHNLAKEKRLGFSMNDDNLIDKLRRAKILSSQMSDKIKDMKKFRNVLVHRYVEIRDEEVHKHATQDLADFEEFHKEIHIYLKAEKKTPKPVRKSTKSKK